MNLLKILCCLDDDAFVTKFNKEIDKSLGHFPYEVIVVKDAIRSIDFLKNNDVQVVICDTSPLGMDFKYFINQIRTNSGGTGVLLLKKSIEHFDDESIVSFEAPINNWTDFVESVREFIPEELKLKFSLERRQSTALSEILNYAGPMIQKRSELTQTWKSDKCSKFVPAEFLSVHAASESTSVNKKSSLNDKVVEIDILKDQKAWWFSFLELVLTLAIIYSAYHFAQNEQFETDSYISVRGISFMLALVSTVTLLISYLFRSFIFLRKVRAK